MPMTYIFIYGLFTVALGFLVFGLVYRWLDHRSKHQAERLRVLEDALKRGDIDDVTREELVEALTGRRKNDAPSSAAPADSLGGPFLTMSGFFGWMCLCIGGVFFILAASGPFSDLAFPGAILCAVGFGLVSFPVVWRELQRPPRRQASERES